MSRNIPGGEVGDSVQREETTQIKAQNTESSCQAWEISTSSAGLQCSPRERSWWGMMLEQLVGTLNCSQYSLSSEPRVKWKKRGSTGLVYRGDLRALSPADCESLSMITALHSITFYKVPSHWFSELPGEECRTKTIISTQWLEKPRQELVQGCSGIPLLNPSVFSSKRTCPWLTHTQQM